MNFKSKVMLDGLEVDMDQLSETGRSSLIGIQFAEKRIAELEDMRALLQRAKNSYVQSLKLQIISNKSGLLLGED